MSEILIINFKFGSLIMYKLYNFKFKLIENSIVWLF